MSNRIDCTLRPSRWASLAHYSAIPVLLVFAWMMGVGPVWLGLGGVAAIVAMRAIAAAQPDYRSMRWEGEQVTLYRADDAEGEVFQWKGRGRRRPINIRFDLESETGSLKLFIWRDSVSDASWRALNAAFRIQSISVRMAQRSR